MFGYGYPPPPAYGYPAPRPPRRRSYVSRKRYSTKKFYAPRKLYRTVKKCVKSAKKSYKESKKTTFQKLIWSRMDNGMFTPKPKKGYMLLVSKDLKNPRPFIAILTKDVKKAAGVIKKKDLTKYDMVWYSREQSNAVSAYII